MIRFLSCLSVTLAVVTVVGAEPVQLTVDGRARTFLLSQPKQKGPHPTIVMLHRGSGKAEEEQHLSQLAHRGPQHGFAVVFPQAIGGYWNFFQPSKETAQYRHFSQLHGGVPDDVAFVRSIVTELAQNGVSDNKRIFLAGRSLGGVMVLRLVCAHAEMFAAAVLLTSAMPTVTGSDCQPAMPTPILIISGSEDRVLPYKGSRSAWGEMLWSTERLVAFFRRLNACVEPSEQSLVSRGHAPDIAIESSTHCSGGPVVLYTLVGGGHDMPAPLDESRTLLDFFRGKTR
jgi:polyhydroxybutyrate depolymerase